ncbi:hypothetical protein AVDCRST_MAG82-2397, partial [uncultured Rubrobacteraceae bacterium]
RGHHARFSGQAQLRGHPSGRNHRGARPAATDPDRLDDHLRRHDGGPIVAEARDVLRSAYAGLRNRGQRTLHHGAPRRSSPCRPLRPIRAPWPGTARQGRGITLAQRLGRHRRRSRHARVALRHGHRLRVAQGAIPALCDGPPRRIVGVHRGFSCARGGLRAHHYRPNPSARACRASAVGGPAGGRLAARDGVRGLTSSSPRRSGTRGCVRRGAVGELRRRARSRCGPLGYRHGRRAPRRPAPAQRCLRVPWLARWRGPQRAGDHPAALRRRPRAPCGDQRRLLRVRAALPRARRPLQALADPRADLDHPRRVRGRPGVAGARKTRRPARRMVANRWTSDGVGRRVRRGDLRPDRRVRPRPRYRRAARVPVASEL